MSVRNRMPEPGYQSPDIKARISDFWHRISDRHWVAPFGDPRIKACLTAPHGFSQPATSFIASMRQGIHQMPFSRLVEPSSCPRDNRPKTANPGHNNDPIVVLPQLGRSTSQIGKQSPEQR